MSQWTVRARVERLIGLTVEADTEAEALAKARDWNIESEQELDTLDYKILSATKDN